MDSRPTLGVAAPRSTALAWIAIAGLLVSGALAVVAVVSDVSYHDLISRAMAGNVVSAGDAQAADNRQNAIGWAQLALFLTTGVLFAAWFHRAYSNLDRLGISGLRWGTKWAVGSWFVPFLNLVRPKSIANDIWRGSDPSLPAESSLPSGPVPWFHTAWWVAFVLAGTLSRISFQSLRNATALSALSSATNSRLWPTLLLS